MAADFLGVQRVKLWGRGQSQHTLNRNRITLIDFARFRNLVPCRKPQREVSTRGMPYCNHAGKIERMFLAQRSQEISACADIQKRSGPATARVTDSSILQVPNCHAFFREGINQRPAVIDVVLREPASAVYVDDHRMWTVPLR